MTMRETVSSDSGVVKTCTKCGQPGEFHKNRLRRDGLHPICKTCIRSYARKPRHVSPKELAAPVCGLRPLLKRRLDHAKRRAHEKRFPFDITMDYLIALYQKQRGKCAISGRPLQIPVPRHRDEKWENSLSIDRIDSGMGYVKGNVRFVIWAVNVAISNRGLPSFLKLCVDVMSCSGGPIAPPDG